MVDAVTHRRAMTSEEWARKRRATIQSEIPQSFKIARLGKDTEYLAAEAVNGAEGFHSVLFTIDLYRCATQP